jgi:hypothetical protein
VTLLESPSTVGVSPAGCQADGATEVLDWSWYPAALVGHVRTIPAPLRETPSDGGVEGARWDEVTWSEVR